MKDKIVLNNMEFYGFHGVYEYERELGQRFYVDLEMTLDLSTAGETDTLEDTLDYVSVYNKVKNVLENTKFKLLEALVQHIADTVLSFSLVQEVAVRVRKQVMPIPGHFNIVQVEITRERKS
ncbi:dihydroneopterin aldolase [Lucifera butyrica]|uniref:7,8-dihydroneopterin aldolase n=1 Tax=Lucifera butyrica TaxID=1351585 RepID=A0A498RDG9_9FIRM|nr:dihydroneopterin aldolase [Lucifera butyrica]VBB08113.1 dihydroneopterin aldolase [Lucifera butyrica]